MPISFEDVAELARSLPEVVEGTWYGAPAFRVGGRVVARLHENEPDLMVIKVGPLERDALTTMQPDRFSLTPHRSERDNAVLMRLSCAVMDHLSVDVHDKPGHRAGVAGARRRDLSR